MFRLRPVHFDLPVCTKPIVWSDNIFPLCHLTGLPVKPLVYVRRVYVPLEQQFKYLSDESSSEDEEWTEGPIKKKDDPTASKGNNKTLQLLDNE